ncbi:unnamed protein product [Malus baccata var. baccata]
MAKRKFSCLDVAIGEASVGWWRGFWMLGDGCCSESLGFYFVVLYVLGIYSLLDLLGCLAGPRLG